jgi:hypothetical protein
MTILKKQDAGEIKLSMVKQTASELISASCKVMFIRWKLLE